MGEYYEKFGPIMYPSRRGKPKELFDGHEMDSNHHHSDRCIKTDLAKRLEGLHLRDCQGIAIEVDHGHVTLEGKVGDEQARQFIAKVADNLFGVKDVSNKLTVVSSPK